MSRGCMNCKTTTANGYVLTNGIYLCFDCSTRWNIYYENWKKVSYPNGLPWQWENWYEKDIRPTIFKQWLNLQRRCFVFR